MSALAVPGGRVKLSHGISCNTFLHNTLQPTPPRGCGTPATPQHPEPAVWERCLHSITSLGSPLAKGCRPLLLSPGPLRIFSCSRTLTACCQGLCRP